MPKRAKIITNFLEFLEGDMSDATLNIYYSLKANASIFNGLPVELVKINVISID